ncbi:MAG: hypothetical protein IPL39_14370 [Opitutaceae bacterium]|nr:hypothetical protein [Opitutaceae bacterium]
MRSATHSFLPLWLPALLVFTAAALLWVGYTGRWNREAWTTAEDYTGDPGEIYARVRLAMDDPLQSLLGYSHSARLAAPFGADWGHYPVGDAPPLPSPAFSAALPARWPRSTCSAARSSPPPPSPSLSAGADSAGVPSGPPAPHCSSPSATTTCAGWSR